jgi:hypothetical protein
VGEPSGRMRAPLYAPSPMLRRGVRQRSDALIRMITDLLVEGLPFARGGRQRLKRWLLVECR